jgi:hypothetical protein
MRSKTIPISEASYSAVTIAITPFVGRILGLVKNTPENHPQADVAFRSEGVSRNRRRSHFWTAGHPPVASALPTVSVVIHTAKFYKFYNFIDSPVDLDKFFNALQAAL